MIVIYLQELWSLFDFVHQGALLGTARTFKMEYENPITRVSYTSLNMFNLTKTETVQTS